jgi:ankyrin repeat protein
MATWRWFGLLAAHADVNARRADIDNSDTALTLAASNGYLEIVQALLAAKADVDAEVALPLNRTALILACSDHHWEVARVLVEAGANVNAMTKTGHTALIEAAYGRSLATVQALLAANANVNGNGYSGETPLIIAAERGRADLVRLLLAAKADVNAKDYDGKTALMSASAGGRLEMVQALLAAKADVNAKQLDGSTALTLALQNDHSAPKFVRETGSRRSRGHCARREDDVGERDFATLRATGRGYQRNTTRFTHPTLALVRPFNISAEVLA